MGMTEKIFKTNKKILVIGNSFDLDLGLKTRFLDFANSEYWPFKMFAGKNTLSSFLNKRKHFDEWFNLEYCLAIFATSPQYASLIKGDEAKKEFF